MGFAAANIDVLALRVAYQKTHTTINNCTSSDNRQRGVLFYSSDDIVVYLDPSFSYRNSLLFHCFMNSDLISDIHFIKFINAANSLIKNNINPRNFFSD